MLECIERIDEYFGGEEARFRNSRLIQDAVVRNLQTLAESSQRLSETIQAGEPEIAGRAIAGFRNMSGAVQPEALGWRQYQNANGGQKTHVFSILRLFGVSGGDQLDESQARELGPTRLAFWDCNLTDDWVTKVENANQMHTEVKSENRINRITGVAEHPRNTERVPAGAEFDFRLSLKVLNGEDDLLPAMLAGLRLIELDSLGGSGSRGYGKVKFIDLKLDGQPLELPKDPFITGE